jgi:hypothetical protein
MIEVFAEKGHMRFAVNIDLGRRSPLPPSSRLLGRAPLVLDRDDYGR